MNQLFISNPELQENLKFGEFDPFADSTAENQASAVYSSHSTSSAAAASSAAIAAAAAAAAATTASKVAKPQYQTEESKEEALRKTKEKELKGKSQLWSALSKNIVRNGHSASKIPSLEIVNHRLNIYKHEIERVDYVELLTKELAPHKQGDSLAGIPGSNTDQSSVAAAIAAAKHKQNKDNRDSSDDENSSSNLSANQEIEYFSFKKRMQMKAKELREKQIEIKQEKQTNKSRSSITAPKQQQLQQSQPIQTIQSPPPPTEDPNIAIIISSNPSRPSRGSILLPNAESTRHSRSSQMALPRNSQLQRGSIILGSSSAATAAAATPKVTFKAANNTGGDDQSSQIEAGVNTSSGGGNRNNIINEEQQYKSKIGKALFLAMQQSKGDKETFRKIAASTLRDYSKSKAALLRPKKFPPTLPRFTQDDNLFLNHIMPDFQNPLEILNKREDPFDEVKDYRPAPGTVEADLLAVVENVSKGKLLNLWRQQQTQ